MEGTLSPMMGMALSMAAAVVTFALGFFMRRNYKRLMQVCSAQTRGIVRDFKCVVSTETEDGKKRKEHTYYPIFVYTVNGQEITTTSSVGSSRKCLKKGQAITVCYNPDNIDQYYVPEDKSTARSGILFMAVGALFFVVGLLIPFCS